MMRNLIFVGWINKGHTPVDGETTKNQYIIAELEKYCKVTALDFYQKNRHPWIYLQALWAIISKPEATIILSTSAKNVYALLKVFKKLHIKRDIIHWVIGGAFGKHIKEGKFRADVFNYVKYNLVQCHGMIEELQSAGVTNARFVSNFKPISYYPDLEKAIAARKASDKIRFVFISRIMPSKGCDYILEAIRTLNKKGFKDKFIVDFYGKIDSSYKEDFINRVNLLDNTTYHGLLDLRKKEGYDTLANYHAMIFPTFHPTEGFSGIFIDAFIAGLPVLASNWAYNAEILSGEHLGLVFPTHDVTALANTMEKCILGEIDLIGMAKRARNEAAKYQANRVMTEEYLKSIKLL